jgi:ribonuclease P protein component
VLLARSSGDEGQGGSPVRAAVPAPGLAGADQAEAHQAASAPAVDAPAQAGARLGIVASRRVGNAVVRNRVKRRLREWFRRRRGELPRGIDLLIIVRPGAGAIGSDELHAELDRALGEIARRSRKL